MKNISRFAFAAASMLLFGACTTGEQLFPNNENQTVEQTVISHRVTLDEAVEKAQRFLTENATSTRNADLRLKNYRIYNAKPASRTDADGSEAEFYILNFENDGGYAVVAADDRATDIYAFAYEGNLDIDEAMENPGFRIFMDGAAEYYDSEIGPIERKWNDDFFKPIDVGGGSSGGSGGGSGSGEDVTKYMITYLDGVPYHTKIEDFKTTYYVAPKTTTKWEQEGPYNNMCFTSSGEQALAGCVPIAMAQIMAYYEYPKSCGDYTLDWDAIKAYDYVMSGTEEADAVAYFIRRIGKIANTKYGVTASSTNKTMVRPTFVSFGYKTGSLQNYVVDAAMASLNKNELVYMRGKNTKGEGHGWVVDGYISQKETTWYYETTAPYSLYRTDYRYRTYISCNWGWGYGYNGYYLNGAFQPSEDDNFTTDLQIIPNIYR